MANFVYNPFRSDKLFDIEANNRQWYDYVQKKEFHNDLKKTVKSESESYRKELRRNAELASKDIDGLRREFANASDEQLVAIQDQTHAIDESVRMVVGSLDEGFSEVSGVLAKGLDRVSEQLSSGFTDVTGRLENITSKIENVGMMLDWRLSKAIDQLKISNLLQENIALLLRVPDFQKERQYYVEQGFKHYKNASLDPDLFKDALQNLLEAEKREPTDYVVLHRIGMVYLYVAECADLVQAESYFRRAAKYSIVESSPDALKALNVLTGFVGLRLGQQGSTAEAAEEVAAKSYFQAGVACYAQGKFGEAAELSGKAFHLSPAFLEAGFMNAKSLCQLGRASDSAEILRSLIQTERFYAVKTVSDSDLASAAEVSNMLSQLRDAAIRQASNRLVAVKRGIAGATTFSELLSEIESFLREGTYLGALLALDELTKLRDWGPGPAVLYFKDQEVDTRILRHEHPLVSLQFSPDGRRLATFCKNASLRIWDTESGSLVGTSQYLRDDNSVKEEHHIKMVFRKDGQLLTNLALDGIRSWSTEDCRVTDSLPRLSFGETGYLQGFSRNGSRILSRAKSDNFYIWDTATLRGISKLNRQFDGTILFADLSPDGRIVLTGDTKDGICIWSGDSGTLVGRIEADLPGRHYYRNKFSFDGRFFATTSVDDSKKRVWDIQHRKIRYEIEKNDRHEDFIDFDPRGNFFITKILKPDNQSVFQSFELNTGNLLYEIPSNWAHEVIFSDDGSTVVTCSSAGSNFALLWNAVDGSQINSIRGLKSIEFSESAQFSPRGNLLAVKGREEVSLCKGLGESRLMKSLEDVVLHGTGLAGFPTSPQAS